MYKEHCRPLLHNFQTQRTANRQAITETVTISLRKMDSLKERIASMRGRSKSGPPPAYSTPRLNDQTADEIERTWALASNDTSLCDCRQKCTRGACAKFAQVWFAFQSKTRPQSSALSRVFGKRHRRPAWRAVLQVWNRNVASLMRKGFSWSSNNLVIGHDFISLHKPGNHTVLLYPGDEAREVQTMLSQQFAPSWGKVDYDSHWPHVRRYMLCDAPPTVTSHQSWAGFLYVFSGSGSGQSQWEEGLGRKASLRKSHSPQIQSSKQRKQGKVTYSLCLSEGWACGPESVL
jgi:hypothetical protein